MDQRRLDLARRHEHAVAREASFIPDESGSHTDGAGHGIRRRSLPNATNRRDRRSWRLRQSTHTRASDGSGSRTRSKPAARLPGSRRIEPASARSGLSCPGWTGRRPETHAATPPRCCMRFATASPGVPCSAWLGLSGWPSTWSSLPRRRVAAQTPEARPPRWSGATPPPVRASASCATGMCTGRFRRPSCHWRCPPTSQPPCIAQNCGYLRKRGWPELPVAISAARGHNLTDALDGYREPGTGCRVPGPGTGTRCRGPLEARCSRRRRHPRLACRTRPAVDRHAAARAGRTLARW